MGVALTLNTYRRDGDPGLANASETMVCPKKSVENRLCNGGALHSTLGCKFLLERLTKLDISSLCKHRGIGAGDGQDHSGQPPFWGEVGRRQGGWSGRFHNQVGGLQEAAGPGRRRSEFCMTVYCRSLCRHLRP